MPRFYFNVHDGSNIIDEDGTEFHDLHSARLEAVAFAGALITENAGKLAPGEDWRMEVTDENYTILFELEFNTKSLEV